jgi:hypothetical protein
MTSRRRWRNLIPVISNDLSRACNETSLRTPRGGSTPLLGLRAAAEGAEDDIGGDGAVGDAEGDVAASRSSTADCGSGRRQNPSSAAAGSPSCVGSWTRFSSTTAPMAPACFFVACWHDGVLPQPAARRRLRLACPLDLPGNAVVVPVLRHGPDSAIRCRVIANVSHRHARRPRPQPGPRASETRPPSNVRTGGPRTTGGERSRAGVGPTGPRRRGRARRRGGYGRAGPGTGRPDGSGRAGGSSQLASTMASNSARSHSVSAYTTARNVSRSVPLSASIRRLPGSERPVAMRRSA